MIATILLVAGVFFLAQIAWMNKISNGIKNPGPAPFLLVGNLPLVLYFGTKLEKFVHHLKQNYGKMFQFWMGWQRVIYCGEPKVVKTILTSDSDSFEKLHWEKHVLAPVMEGGLIILNGDDWKAHHRTINPFFNTELYSVLCKEVAEAVKKREFRKLVSEILSKLIFGWSFHEREYFVNTVELLNNELEERAKDLLKLRPYVAFREVAECQKAKAEGEERMLGFIQEARKRRANQPEPTGERKFRYLIDIMLNDKDFTDMDILHEIKTLFGASETTVHLMTWGIYALAQNPDAEERLITELESAFSKPNIGMDQIISSPYLNATVNECLRMFPPAPAMFRQAACDTVLDDKITVDKGTVIAICPFFIHKDEDYWEEPEKFMPERFLEPSNSKEWQGDNINNPAFIPFGNGKRQCIETSALLAALVKSYKFSVVPGQKIEPVTGIKEYNRKLDIDTNLDILNRPRYGIEVVQSPRVQNGAEEGGVAMS